MSVILGEGVYDDMAADLPPWSGVDRPTLVKVSSGKHTHSFLLFLL